MQKLFYISLVIVVYCFNTPAFAQQSIFTQAGASPTASSSSTNSPFVTSQQTSVIPSTASSGDQLHTANPTAQGSTPNNMFGVQSASVGTTFPGTTPQAGPLSVNGPSGLPITQTGLQAISGGYTGPACDQAGTGGFGATGVSTVYPSLPPTSTSTVDIEVGGY